VRTQGLEELESLELSSEHDTFGTEETHAARRVLAMLDFEVARCDSSAHA
jgi:hypothetical protein